MASVATLRNKAFTVEILGEGMFQAMVAAEGEAAAPKSVWFERTPRFRAAVAAETIFAASGAMDPAHVPAAFRAQRNVDNPPPTTVSLRFASNPPIESVWVAGPKGTRNLAFDVTPAPGRSYDEVVAFVRRVLEAIADIV